MTANSKDIILCTVSKDTYSTKEFLSKLINILKPDGKLVLPNVATSNDIEFDLKTNGFVNVSTADSHVTCFKPKYAVGSAVKLNFKKNDAANVWKLDDTVDDEIETIDPDNLLDEDDLKKPDPSSLRGIQSHALRNCSFNFLRFSLWNDWQEEGVQGLLLRIGRRISNRGAKGPSCGYLKRSEILLWERK